MTDLEIAVADWRRAFLKGGHRNHPTVWVGHYADILLGSLWIKNPDDRAEAALWMACPFAYTDAISSVFIVCDLYRKLRITRISSQGRGVRITNWELAYHITDRGDVTFDPASYTYEPLFPTVVSSLVDERLNGDAKFTFDKAYDTARWLSNAVL